MSYDTNGDLNIGGVGGSHATLSVTGQANLYSTPDNLVIGAGESSNGLLYVSGAGSSAILSAGALSLSRRPQMPVARSMSPPVDILS